MKLEPKFIVGGLVLLVLLSATLAVVLARAGSIGKGGVDKRTLLGLAGSAQGKELEILKAKVQRLGTNAVPSLLDALELEYSPIHDRFSNWATRQSWLNSVRRFSTAFERADEFRHGAYEGFKIIGHDAMPAIPALEIALQKPLSALYAIKILCMISNVGKLILGPEVYPILLKGLTNQNSEVRAEAASGLGHAQTNAQVVVPALLRCLKDPDANVRARAAIQLGGPAFQLKSAEIIGALIPLLSDTNDFVRRFTSIRLGLYRAAATNALADLRQLAEREKDSEAKQAEIKAIRQIEQNHY